MEEVIIKPFSDFELIVEGQYNKGEIEVGISTSFKIDSIVVMDEGKCIMDLLEYVRDNRDYIERFEELALEEFESNA